MKQKVIIAVVVIALIAVGIYAYTRSGKDNTVNDDNQTNNANMSNEDDIIGEVPGDPDEDPQTPTSDTIAVSTQLAGEYVTIDNAFLSKPGFIVILEAGANGQPGKAIGSSGYLSVGAKQDLEVPAKIAAGGKYYAAVYADNGDKKYTTVDTAASKDNLPIQTMFSVSQ